MTTGTSSPQPGAPINVQAFLENPELLQKFEFKAQTEPGDERKSRLHREAITTYTQLAIEFVTTIAVIIGIGYICTIFIGIATNSNASADAQKTALSALTALVGVAGGYIFGKRSAK